MWLGNLLNIISDRWLICAWFWYNTVNFCLSWWAGMCFFCIQPRLWKVKLSVYDLRWFTGTDQ
jgi:hypothetical protein